jgi:hypothetical protein
MNPPRHLKFVLFAAQLYAVLALDMRVIKAGWRVQKTKTQVYISLHQTTELI